MMKKQELLGILKEALDKEEKSIPVYMKHLQSAVFWTGINEDKAQKAKELLAELAHGSVIHKGTIEELIKEVQGQDRDAF